MATAKPDPSPIRAAWDVHKATGRPVADKWTSLRQLDGLWRSPAAVTSVEMWVRDGDRIHLVRVTRDGMDVVGSI